MDQASTLRTILSADRPRWRILRLVRSLGLPDCWIGAGFVRNAVWDHLHGRPPRLPTGDVDVLWFADGPADLAEDSSLQTTLRNLDPKFDWSVKNQARMHLRNGDASYASATDAMRHWPETATAVAVRLDMRNDLAIAAPFGLHDLFGLVLRPSPGFTDARHPVFLDRIRTKAWLASWPLLTIRHGDPPSRSAAAT